jgi:RNase P/RNase MRP subunit POP5
MKRLKLKSTSRLKRRYLLLAGGSKEQINSALLHGLGAIGLSEVSPQFVNISKGKPKDSLVLAINRQTLDSVRAAFELAHFPIKITKVSGTLSGLSRNV